MSIFGKIMSTIFGGAAQAAPGAARRHARRAGGRTDAAVDVTAILDKMTDEQDEDLDWRKSIVDLMKL